MAWGRRARKASLIPLADKLVQSPDLIGNLDDTLGHAEVKALNHLTLDNDDTLLFVLW